MEKERERERERERETRKRGTRESKGITDNKHKIRVTRRKLKPT